MDFNWRLNTRKAFQLCNCYPSPGFSINFWNFRNKDILGSAYTLSAFMEAHFINKKRISLAIRPGLGLAYLTKPYDEITNPNNLAYSTQIGYSVLLNFTGYYNLSGQWLISAGLNYNHISNGGVKIPNKGINFPTFGLGIEYSVKPLNYNSFNATPVKDIEKKHAGLFALFTGFKGIIYDDKTYLVYGITGKYLHQLGRVSFLSGGSEFNIDKSKLTIARSSRNVQDDAQYIISILAGYEHKFSRFRTSIDLGVYVRNPDQSKDMVYQRYGLKYIIKNYFIGINLKAHRHYAEYFDIRTGIIF